jgi:colicin import membrane protein
LLLLYQPYCALTLLPTKRRERMSFSRQALLGIGMIIGGSVMLYAMVQQIGTSNDSMPAPALVEKAPTKQVALAPLTTDIETEKRILAQKQQERAVRVNEQEKRAQQFLVEQETAEAEALAKARAENERYVANTTPTAGDKDSVKAAQNEIATPTIQPRTAVPDKATVDSKVQQSERAAAQKQAAQQQAETKKQAAAQAKQQADAEAKKQANLKRQTAEKLAAEKKKQAAETQAEADKKQPPTAATDYKVKSGDGLLRLARQYNVSVEALAQANDLSPSASLQLGQTLTIPSRKQIARLEREAASAEQARTEKRKKEEALTKKSVEAKRDAQQKLQAARKEVQVTDAKGSFGVQVALASNQAAADEVAKEFKAAGYQVKTSATSRGVRVIVGPERGKIAALALKDKVNSDPKVNTTSAWVLYWR